MKRLFTAGPVACLLCLVVSVAVPASAGALVSTGDGSWFWRSPQPQGNQLLAAASSGSTVWAVGDGGTVLVSLDAGLTWESQASGTFRTLRDVMFVDGLTGWAVGGDTGESADGTSVYRNVIVHTDDGGLTWQEQAHPGKAPLTSVFFLDGLHGWAVGERGTILRTSDGGATWARCLAVDRSSLTSVHFSDALHGWTGGALGVTWRTGDGGATWRRSALPHWGRELRLMKQSFADTLRGYAIFGDAEGAAESAVGPVVAVTEDGGIVWRRVLAGDEPIAVGAGPGDRVWVVRSTAEGAVRYFVSEDAGATWASQYLNGIFPQDVVPVASGACAVGWGGIFSSADGTTWQPRTSSSYGPEFTFAAAPEGTLVGAGSVWIGGSVKQRSLTSMDGVTWTPGGVMGSGITFDLETPDGQHILAAELSYSWVGTLVRSDNGGLTWSVVRGPSDGLLLDLAYPDPTHAWAAGTEGTRFVLLASTDGGKTWQKQSVPAGYSPYALEFVSATEGWAAVASERAAGIVHTADGGAHWNLQSTSLTPGAWVDGLDFVDDQHGWAVLGDLDSGTSSVMSTTDGGQTWTRSGGSTFTGHYLTGLAFADGLVGWVWAETGSADDVWRTSDGGATWQQELIGAAGVVDIETVGGVAYALSSSRGVLSTADLPGDNAPPFTCNDVDRKYHRDPVTVTLTAADVGGQVVSTEYRVDDAAEWLPYEGPIPFDAPADHGGDGRHILHYRSSDTSGNVGSFEAEVPIDTLGPSTTVLRSTTAVRGVRTSVAVKVADATSPRAHVVLRFSRLSDGRTGRAVRADVGCNREQKVRFICRLLPGRYRVTVEATDLAGNRQVHAGRGLLVVKPAGS